MKRINWVLVMCVVFSQGSVWATVIHVPSDQATIQAGINIALPGDSVLVADGTYSENLTIGKAIALLSENGPAGCVVNGNNLGRVILVDSVVGCKIIGFTIKKGYLSSANFPDGFGAGILVLNSTVDIINCNIDSNYAQGGAGGIAMLDGPNFTIKDSRIFGNQTPAATGGVLASNSTGRIEKSVIAYNQAQHCGGVFLYSDNFTSFVDLVNNTICNNVSQVQGSGIECRRTSSDIRNNIIAYNHGAYGIWSSLSTVTFEYNDLWSNEVGNDSGVTLGVGNIEQDPLFADTSSFDYRLYACSPCIDSGDTATVYTDPDGTRNDIGAISHDKSAPRVIRVPLECPTTQKGVNAAQYGDTVLVGPGTYYEVDTLKSGITLRGENGADSTIIDGRYNQGQWGNSVITCNNSDLVRIEGFTITGGYGSYGFTGGGIYCWNSKLNLGHCSIRGNSVRPYPGPGMGGGIYSNTSTLDISNCIIENNSATGVMSPALGGGIYSDVSSYLILKHSKVRGNGAYGEQFAFGGGIYSEAKRTVIDSNLIYNNSCIDSRGATTRGGGIYLVAESASIKFNIVALNEVHAWSGPSCQATAEGGGIYASGTSSELSGNTFYQNNALVEGGCHLGAFTLHGARGGGVWCQNLDLKNNIISYNNCEEICPQGYSCADSSHGGGVFAINVNSDCNDYFHNYVNGAIEHLYGGGYGLNDFSSDPLFCLPESLDFHLLENSSCANAPVCGQVGALPIGCTSCLAFPGDANSSGNLSLADIIATVNYIFNKSGCSVTPDCWLSNLICRGDWNGSLSVTLADVIHGVNYIFSKPGGPWIPVPSGVCCLPL